MSAPLLQSGSGKAVDAAAIKEGNITGTNKDLRRLSMVESKNLLLKLGLSEEDIKGSLLFEATSHDCLEICHPAWNCRLSCFTFALNVD